MLSSGYSIRQFENVMDIYNQFVFSSTHVMLFQTIEVVLYCSFKIYSIVQFHAINALFYMGTCYIF